MYFSNIIVKEKVNNKRHIEVDLFRGFTAIILIICHVVLYWGDNGNQALYVFGDIIGSEFGAPVFMAMMGMSMIFTRHNSPKDFLKRGIILFISGCLLNIVRSLIPYFVMRDMDWFATFNSIFVVDILLFAGLAFIFIALLKKIKVPAWGMVLIALAFAGIDQWIFTLEQPITSNNGLACFLNLFIPVNEYSCFPFLTWFFFPAFGSLLGEILVRTKDEKKLYIIYLVIGLIAAGVVYGLIIYLYPDYTSYYAGGNFYYQGVGNLLLNGLLICLGLSFWYFLSKVIPQIIKKYLVFLSVTLNSFYWISWLIIGTGIHIIAYYSLVVPTYLVIIYIFVVLIATSLFTWLFMLTKKKIKTKKNSQNIELIK